MPANDLEAMVTDGIRTFLGDVSRVHDAAAACGFDHNALNGILALAAARALDPNPTVHRDIIERVDVHDDRVDICVAIGRLDPAFDAGARPVASHLLSLPTVRLRRGKEIRLMLPGADGGLQASPDPALIKLLANAFAARDAVDAATGARTLSRDVAKANGYSLEYFSLLLRLSMLAPDIVGAIHDGRQPPALNRQRLARITNLPVEWSAQRARHSGSHSPKRYRTHRSNHRIGSASHLPTAETGT